MLQKFSLSVTFFETCPVYSVAHALKILEIIQEIFLDIPNFDEVMDILRLDGTTHCPDLEKTLEDIDLSDVDYESEEDQDEIPEEMTI